jgi:predicted 3-demethylubiquinone-9 3-methyltransferase (glyoxalase superfamily)
MKVQKITPFLWFDGNAEEAARFYVSVFRNAKMGDVFRTGDNQPPLTVSFELEGLRFTALNGGPQFKFTEGVSFYVNCESEEELDYYWTKLLDVGAASMCGWLKDRFGLSWQIIPEEIIAMFGDKDRAKANRAVQAMLQMQKIIDLPALRKAYSG